MATALTPEAVGKLHRTLGRVPYSGLVSRRWDGETVDDLIRWLNDLGTALEYVSGEEEKRTAELTRLQRLMSGGRALLDELTKGNER